MKRFAILLSILLTILMICSVTFAEDAAPAEEEEVLSEKETTVTDVSDIPFSEEGEAIIGDYSVIEIPVDQVKVEENEIDSYIESILECSETTELTDEFILEYSVNNLDEQCNTIEELQEYAREYLYTNKLRDAILNSIMGKIEVISYPEATYEIVKAYAMENIEYYVDYYAKYGLEGFDEDLVAMMNGFPSAEDYCNYHAKADMQMIMMIDAVCEDKGIECTDEELDQYVADIMTANEYDTMYTIEEFKEINGEGWLLIAKYKLLQNKVLEALEENVVFTAS